MMPVATRRRRKPEVAPGTFSGPVHATFLVEGGEDRNIQLEEDLCYRTRDGYLICARKGEIVDGASIPSFAWVLIGSPLTGDYRRASVIHDVECRRRARPAADVHRTFREAMEADGVGRVRRTLMWWCVKTFGPKW